MTSILRKGFLEPTAGKKDYIAFEGWEGFGKATLLQTPWALSSKVVGSLVDKFVYKPRHFWEMANRLKWSNTR